MIRTQDQEIQALVADIRDGKLLLPEMQRAYVWKSGQVRDLFDSLYHEYPSGQLLVWETDDLPASGNRRASVEGPSVEQRRPQLLLDGQQRLTSLAAVMLGRPLRVRDMPKPIDIAFNVFTEKFEVASTRHRAQTGWVSLVRLFTEGAMSVFKDLNVDLRSPEAQTVLERLNRLDNIKKYRYRVNVLDRLSYAEVTRIFVRTNSGGTKLGYADLALAQVSSTWQGVTEEFERYQQNIKKQGIGLKLDNGLLLRAIVVLLTGQSRFTRFFWKDRREVSVDELKSAWERARRALDQAIAFLMNNCLIDRLQMLPTRSILMPLVAFFDRYGAQMNDKQARELQRWVYMALIWTRYSSSSETAMDQDIAALAKEEPVQALIQNIEDVVGQRPITERELLDQRRNSPLMLMAYVLARRAQAQDWFNGVVIGNNRASEPYVHHIFPKTLLGKRDDLKQESRTLDQVANLVFLSGEPGRDMQRAAPVEYLPKIEEQRLRAQCVPLQPELWSVERFEDFMRQRRTLLADAMNHLLQSLTEEPRIWVHSPARILESRVDALERALRTLVAARLTESHGEKAWDSLVPSDIRNSLTSRIKKREAEKPFEAGMYTTLDAKLAFCQFSDYFKIIKMNWLLFEDVFGSEKKLEQYSGLAVEARNALKHGRDLTHVDLSSAEAGLTWLEECLSRVRPEDEGDEETIAEAV